jgi:CheY-like chemotaxis protein
MDSDQRSILIVDDDEHHLRYVSVILEREGYAYRVAGDGNEALALMREQKPDLVLLDIMMPKSGALVLKEMKRDAELRDIPVIVVTGAAEATGVDLTTGEEAPRELYSDEFQRATGNRIHQTLERYAPDGFIEKPVEPKTLLAEIERIFS